MPPWKAYFETPNGAPKEGTRSAAGDGGGVTYKASFVALTNRGVMGEVLRGRNTNGGT